MSHKTDLLPTIVACLLLAVFPFSHDTLANRDTNAIHIVKQLRLESSANSNKQYEIAKLNEIWNPKQTALIICDVWDLHHCFNAVERLEEMIPRMNAVTQKLRSQGVLIIHAPSSCMNFYKDHPGRKLAQQTPKAANLPQDIDKWCHKIPAEEKGKYPIDQSDGGEDDDPVEHAKWAAKLKDMGRNPRSLEAAARGHQDRRRRCHQ